MLKPMARSWLLGGLVYALVLAGLATLNGRVVILALPFTVYLIAGLLGRPEALRLKATRSLSADRASQNTPIGVRLSIMNEGPHLAEFFVEDVCSHPFDLLEGKTRLLAPLASGARAELEYTLRGGRGAYRFEAVQVVARDPLGAFERQVTLPAPGRVIVLPDALRIRRVAIRPRQTRVYSGLIPARRGGPGVEFFGVRGYQAGDPTRWINWNASARHPDALFTNEFEQERVADVGVIVDARRRSHIRAAGVSLFESTVQAAAALAQSALGDGNRVGLLVYGSFLDWTIPGYGKTQRERILQALARAEPGDSLVFDNLDLLPTRLFPPESQLILVSPLVQDDLPVLIRLRARGYQVLVISPDPIPLEVERLAQRSGRSLTAPRSGAD